VVRNLPEKSLATPPEFKLPNLNNRKVILYQGALNMGRGLEAAIRAMQFIDGAVLVLAGNGDIVEPLKQLAEKQGVANQVIFTGRLALEHLAGLTRLADLGLSIEEDLGLNYRFALPNKLFDYIQAGVPVLVSDLRRCVTWSKNTKSALSQKTIIRSSWPKASEWRFSIWENVQSGNKISRKRRQSFVGSMSPASFGKSTAALPD
jgi:hypothetical protein